MQHHATTQNSSKQLAQCNFHHVCSCMDPVLFSNMLKETRTDVQWVMLVKAFPRLVGTVKLVWTLCEFRWWKVQLDYKYVRMVSSLTSPPTPPTPPTPHNHTEYQQQLEQWNFHHVCSCMGSVLVCNMLKETGAVDYVGQVFPEVGWYGKTCLNSLLNLVVESAVRI